mmetsp:Transcript_25132/g.43934  ORF Transcript_25132/g.43934 Transcript_25132/m.43934 type:complete len:97 (-) Transcript_25132:165-455(-)
MSSFVVLNGPSHFAKALAQKEKLPFSGAYVIGLLGTLWGTLIAKSYIFTAIFAITQAVALLYFVCSYLPGGKSMVNICCRGMGRGVRGSVRTLLAA